MDNFLKSRELKKVCSDPSRPAFDVASVSMCNAVFGRTEKLLPVFMSGWPLMNSSPMAARPAILPLFHRSGVLAVGLRSTDANVSLAAKPPTRGSAGG